MTERQKFRLKLPFGRKLLNDTLFLGEHTLIMGVLNVTPDSFSDGGNFFSPEKAVKHAMQMERDGADVIDVGAESTRPGSHELSAEEEWSRLAPVLSAICKRVKIPISIDTRKSEIAQRAIEGGAAIINDVSGLHYDPRIAKVAAQARVLLILMHMRGEPLTMQQKPFARNVIKDVLRGLRASVAIALKAGVAKSQIIVDPGIGFGKSWAQNYELLQKLPEIAKLKFPLLIGTSRKGFIGRTLSMHGKPASTEMKIWGTAATVTASILNGVHIVRVHDVAEMSRVARIADCILNPRLAPKP